MTQPGPQRQYAGRSAAERRADRRSRLVDAGLQMFGTVGYAMAPVGRICKVANLSTRQYYEEFGSREALLITVYDTINTEAIEAVAKAVAALGNATLTARVEAALRTYARSTASDLRSARVAYLEIVGVNPAIEAHRMAWRRRWVTLIGGVLQAAIERGEIADRDYRLAAGAFVGAANGLLQDWCATDDRAPLDDVVAELSRLADALTR
ncbi:TetR/AcrR family transcriptional regulator [Fodinicola feengrottensis]|uniref:TetR/AcrR family transcriptional regulator n=1 Tax=Fodinicola feengrottensis TaxID=435914 RepID=A0ABP4S2B6_9ACTN